MLPVLCYNNVVVRHRFILSLVIGLAHAMVAFRASPECPITSASAVGRLTERQYGEHLGFCLTGTIVWQGRFNSLILKSGTHRLYARLSMDEELPATGSVATIRGQTNFDFNRQQLLCVTSLVVHTQAPVSPPEPVTARQLKDGDYNLHIVRVQGTVTDAFHDEIDHRWDQFVMKDGAETFLMAVPKNNPSENAFDRFIGAEIEVTGAYLANLTGLRNFMPPVVTLNGYSDLKILHAAPDDPFDAPPLEFIHHVQPAAIAKMGRRRVRGTVLATWQGEHFLLSSEDGQSVSVTTLHNRDVPRPGECVEVVGFPETDLFHLNISRAIFRKLRSSLQKDTTQPLDVTADDVLLYEGKRNINASYHGRLIRLAGIVRSLSPPGHDIRQFVLENNGFQIPVDFSSLEDRTPDIGLGYTVSATGICLMESENWRPDAIFPRLSGFTLVLRSPDDISVLSRPPWWTPGRMMLVVCVLFATLLVIFFWNRMLNRLVEQRSRKLMREEIARAGAELKLEERTRLATELHDTIAQNLTGVALQIDAAQMAFARDPAMVAPYLESTRLKMKSCRENLRDCLWDLRNRAFEESELDSAIRKTITPHLETAEARIDCAIHSRSLSDNTIHAVLCIVRELVVNAVRHGKARTIEISVCLHEEKVFLQITDNGIGFDPVGRPGTAKGHFGLQGVEERIHRLGGKLAIQSAPNRGTTIIITELDSNG